MQTGLPRIAASSYLNTAPLVWSFIHGSRRGQIDLLTDTAPARCGDMLGRGEVDCALVPVIEYHRIPGITVVPGVCVGSRGVVRSVVVVSRDRELGDVRTVALDTSSRTSAALLKIIFREFIGREPEWRQAAPDLDAMLAAHDAALVIGDPAMLLDRHRLRVYDMAALWREHTGLGFVFAMWMASDAALERVRGVDFAGARDEGLANSDAIIAQAEKSLELPRSELREYLHENLSFHLGDEMRAGLELYFKLAAKCGVIPGQRPLKWL